MANVDRPRGFSPIGTFSGSPYQATIKLFYLDGTANDTLIAVGDPVVMAGGGYLNRLAAGNGAADLVGVVVGIPPAPETFSTTIGTFGNHDLAATSPTISGAAANYVAASTAGYVYVATAPDLLVVGQEDGDTDPLELADVGAAVDIIWDTPAYSTTTGISNAEIDSNTHGTQAGDPLRLIGLANTPGNTLGDVDTTTPWADWVCTWNTHWTKDDGGV